MGFENYHQARYCYILLQLCIMSQGRFTLYHKEGLHYVTRKLYIMSQGSFILCHKEALYYVTRKLYIMSQGSFILCYKKYNKASYVTRGNNCIFPDEFTISLDLPPFEVTCLHTSYIIPPPPMHRLSPLLHLLFVEKHD